MKPKQALIEFLKHAPQSPDHLYSFTMPGDDTDAINFLHRMRVELSRTKKKFRRMNKQFKPFKMYVVKREANKESRTVYITLQFATNSSERISDEVDEIFELISREKPVSTIDERHARGLDTKKPAAQPFSLPEKKHTEGFSIGAINVKT